MIPSAADAQDVGHQLLGLRRVHAGGRLVEEQQARARGERARDLEPPPVGVGQRGGGLRGARREAVAKEAEQLERLRSSPALLGARPGVPTTMLASPLRVRQCMPTSTFSSTVIWLKQRWFWKVRAIPSAVIRCGGSRVRSCWPSANRIGRRSRDAGR